MFEQSLLGVNGRERRRGTSIVTTSIILQTLLLAWFATAPLLYPATMPPYKYPEPKTISLVQPRPQPVIVKHTTIAASSTSAASASSEIHEADHATAAPMLRPAISNEEAPDLLLAGDGGGMAAGSSPSLIAATGNGNGGANVVAKAPAASRPLNISTGVSAGLLLAPLRPIYPGIARVARVAGTVVVTATIDKRGQIIGLRVLSGPAMLQTAAADAVRDARYRPYLLNGSPVEVTTTFSVNFVLGTS